MLAVHLVGSSAHPIDARVGPAETADIHRPQIVGWLTAEYPFGQRFTGAAPRRNTKCIEAGADEVAGHFRRFTEDEVSVRREALGTVEQLLDAGRFQSRYPRQCECHELLEMIPVRIEQCEVKAVRDTVGSPGQWIGLVTAHDETTDFFLVIGEAIGIAQGRQIAGHAIDGLRDHVLVLYRHQRHVDSGKAAKLVGPLATAVDDDLTGNTPLLRQHCRYTAVAELDPRYRTIFNQHAAVHARALCQRLRDVGGIRLPVGGQECRAHQIVDGHQRPQLAGLGWCQQVHLEAEAVSRRGLALELDHALGVAGES